MLLNDFISNDKVKNELREVMSLNKLPHAIIIDGAKGTGKRTLAMIIARYCVCSSESDKPCNICSDCIKADRNIHPDIIVLDGNISGSLNIEAIRNLRSSAYIKPNEAPKKVYILLNCDRMLTPAQNAFLKVLEEPPENVVFIMTCTSSTMLLQTVRSRSRIYTLYPAEQGNAVEFISKVTENKTVGEIEHAVSLCGGNIGQALHLLENNVEDARKLAEEIFQSIPQSTGYQLMLLINQITSDRNTAVSVLDELMEISMEAVKISVGAKSNSEIALKTAIKLTSNKILEINENIRKARELLDVNVNMNLFGMWLYSMLKI